MSELSNLDWLRQQMERELEDFRRYTPLDFTFEPRLKSFLAKWERNFAPYVQLEFTYRLEGYELDIHASIPQPAKFIVDITRRSYIANRRFLGGTTI